MLLFLAALALQPAPVPASPAPPAATSWPTREGDVALTGFAFRSGEKLPSLRIHYTTLGSPHRNAAGEIDNADSGERLHYFLSRKPRMIAFVSLPTAIEVDASIWKPWRRRFALPCTKRE